MSAPMTRRNKTILVNCSAIAALIYQHWKGIPLFIFAISGIFILVFANLLMMFAAKRRPDTIAK
jgi:hypothetical protein